MRTELFDYDLPEDRIALRPARPRDAARLLVVRPPDTFEDRIVSELPSLLAPGDAMVFNDTRVINAALEGVRVRGEGRACVAFNLIKRVDANRWRALARPAKRLAVGDRVTLGEGGAVCGCVAGGDPGDGSDGGRRSTGPRRRPRRLNALMFFAASATARMRATLEAKIVTTTRRRAFLIRSARDAATSASDGDLPSRRALVESHTIAATPSAPTTSGSMRRAIRTRPTASAGWSRSTRTTRSRCRSSARRSGA